MRIVLYIAGIALLCYLTLNMGNTVRHISFEVTDDLQNASIERLDQIEKHLEENDTQN